MSHLNSNLMVVSMLQVAKSQLDLLIQMASTNTSTEVMATMAETFTKMVDGAMKIRQTIDVAESVAESVAETMSITEPVADEVPAEAAPTSVGKTWSVHDCHTHCKGKSKGIWAREAVANGTYGICVGPSKDSKETTNEKILGPLGEVIVSKRRWKNAKDISLGDTLFMGDTHIKKVFKGTVTAQPVNGPFCPQESLTNSFIGNLSDRKVGDEALLAREVEIVFKVDWAEVAPLTEEWKDYLGTARRETVSSLTAAPPA
jgi:hypothetical protein